MNFQTSIHICGVHRSGTSLLHHWIRGHDDISGFSATGHPKDEGQFLQSVFPRDAALGGPGRFGLDSRSHLDESSALCTEENRAKLISEWASHYDLSKRYVVEKTPATIVRTRFLQALLPDARFIAITRHPVAVAFATAKFSPTTDLEILLQHWLACHDRLAADAPHLNWLHRLTHEDLVRTPLEATKQVFDRLNLPPSPPPEKIRGNPNLPYLMYWRALPPRQRESLIDKFEGRVRRHGYSLVDFQMTPNPENTLP